MNTLSMAGAVPISRDWAYNLITKGARGTFFRASFVRSDGTIREMLCRLGVKRHTAGGTLTYDPRERGNIIVWDTVVRDYRTIPTDRLLAFRMRGTTYKVI